MGNSQQSEEMRPIPDGGLKDAMPGWLKRPPAWRNMPTAEERHERTLPEPDTSGIDPRTLVDVSDLPQWLQAIATRGDVPVPDPDPAVEHAVEQVQAATFIPRREEQDATEVRSEIGGKPVEDDKKEASGNPELGLLTDETTETKPSQRSVARLLPWIWGGIIALIVLMALVLLVYYYF